MDLDTELARELERAIPHLPTAPVSSHLSAGRRARRRRHAYAGVAGVAFLAITVGGALSALDGPTPTAVDRLTADSPSASRSRTGRRSTATTAPPPSTRTAGSGWLPTLA